MDELDNINNKEYYWKEMYYNINIRDDEDYKDIYDDMEWWYEYQLKEWDIYEE